MKLFLRDKQEDAPKAYCQCCGAELYEYDNWEEEICDDCQAMLMDEEEYGEG